jgi:hypothetical protein
MPPVPTTGVPPLPNGTPPVPVLMSPDPPPLSSEEHADVLAAIATIAQAHQVRSIFRSRSTDELGR